MIQRPPVEVWLVPLPGHSPGQCGVAVGRVGRWLLHGGDAYLRQSQVGPGSPEASPSPFPRWARHLERWLFPPAPVARLRDLQRRHGDQVRLFCAHDRARFHALRGGR